MNYKEVIKILEKAQVKGAAVEIDLKKLPEYIKYKNAKLVEKKVRHGIRLAQELINSSNLDKAEKILNEVEDISDEEEYMGSVWEKRGWIADARDKWDKEIKYFEKAREIYKTIPGSTEVEGHKDDRILTVKHFTGRALYFRGKKSDLTKCEKLFTDNLAEYKKLKHHDAVGFNYFWLARTYIAMKNVKKAEEMARLAMKYFDKTSNQSFSFRIMAEVNMARGEKEKAIENATESLRYILPAGTYYNGVSDAVKYIS